MGQGWLGVIDFDPMTSVIPKSLDQVFEMISESYLIKLNLGDRVKLKNKLLRCS